MSSSATLQAQAEAASAKQSLAAAHLALTEVLQVIQLSSDDVDSKSDQVGMIGFACS